MGMAMLKQVSHDERHAGADVRSRWRVGKQEPMTAKGEPSALLTCLRRVLLAAWQVQNIKVSAGNLRNRTRALVTSEVGPSDREWFAMSGRAHVRSV